MQTAITILKKEHRSIAAVLHGLQHLAKLAMDAAVRPQFQVFRAMLRYIDEYPERLHHPKEDKYLFARLAERAPEARALIDDLTAEHVKGAKLVRDLERALLFFEEGWPEGGREFLRAADAYAEFHWEHMRKEERELLPIAERVLGAQDWKAIDEAFRGNDDPLSDLREHDFEALFTRIAHLAPAPIGLGEPWKKSA